MRTLLAAVLVWLLCITTGWAQSSGGPFSADFSTDFNIIGSGCTNTTCPMALPPGYLTTSGNQFVNNLTNVRPACARFDGTPNDGSMPAIRTAGFNCITISWRDAYLSAGGSVPTTFDDEFSSAAWLTHEAWQSGDQWSFVGTSFHTGTSQGPTWWANPIDTPSAASVYSNSSGHLNLALIKNPGGNGITNTTLGALINNQLTPGGLVQQFGYSEFSVAVPATPGMLFQWDEECQPATCSDGGMEIDAGIWTNGDGSKHVRFWSQAAGLGNPIYYETTAIDITQQHVYGINWQSDFLTFYIDGTQVAQVPNPGGEFQTNGAFSYFLTSDATYFGYGPAFTASSATAVLDYYHVYQTRPTGAPPIGCNTTSQIATCVSNATTAGLKVILEHAGNEAVATSNACFLGAQPNGLWYDTGGIAAVGDGCGTSPGTVSPAQFQSDWVGLATSYANNTTVIGAALHHEPAIVGGSGLRATTGGGGGGSGGFTANNGQIFDPNGVAWVARGINLDIGDISAGNVPLTKLQSLFPRLNYIRVVNQFGGSGCAGGTGYCNPITPGNISAWVASVTAVGIRVEFSDYAATNCGSDCGGGQGCRSGTDLANANAWYAQWAAFFKGNPFVSWESQNECQTPGWQAQVTSNYNAVRSNAPNAQFTIGLADGNFQINYEIDQAQLNLMSNVIFDGHPYLGNSPNWCNSTQSVCNNGLIAGLNVFKALSTNTETHIPMIFGEYGDSASGQGSCCDSFWPNNLTGVFATMSTGGSTSTNNGSAAWIWYCNCGSLIGDLLTGGGSNPQIIDDGGQQGARYQAAIASAPGSGPTPLSGGGGTTPINVTWNGGGTNNSDVLQMCSTVGAAINAANSGLVIFCPGLINSSAQSTLLSGAAKPSDCLTMQDLSSAGAHPMTGFPANKMAYDVDFSPRNVMGTGCVDSGATLPADLNAYFGYLEVNNTAPVMNMAMGCSCDGTNGNLADDNAWGSAITQYMNGQASGGPTFTGLSQPMAGNWIAWYYPENVGSGFNPNGILQANNTTLNPGQQTWWSTLLFTGSGGGSGGVTTWNPADDNNMALSGNNLIATSGASGIANVRSTTSKSSGRYCWEITATTISNDWGMGIANSAFNLATGLSSDSNGIGFFPGKAAAPQVAFFNNAELTLGSNPSVNGEKITECQDFTAGLAWFTDSQMRTDSGAGSWNNSNTCDPTVAACGLSTSGLTCPCFLIYHNAETGIAALNTTGSFAVSLPSGFTTFDTPVVVGRSPVTLILGANDNFKPASNDNWLLASYRSYK